MLKNILSIFTLGFLLSFNSYVFADDHKIQSDGTVGDLIILL